MRIANPDELFTHPVAIELELWHRGRLHERAQIVEQILSVDVGGNKAFLVQPFGHLTCITLLGNPQNSTHGRGKTVRQARHQAEVDYTQPAVLHELEVAWMRIGMQQTGGARPSEEEAYVLQSSRVALLVGKICG